MRNVWRSYLWLTGAVALASLAQAADKIELKANVQTGMRWVSEQDTKFVNELSVTMNQGDAQQMTQRISQHTRAEVEVLEARNGLPTALKIHFADDCATKMEQNGQDQAQPFPLAGKTIEARMSADGKLTIKPEELGAADEVRTAIQNMFESVKDVFPKGPIAIGDSWKWSDETVRRQFDLAEGDAGSVELTLTGVDKKDGRPAAQLAIAVTMKKLTSQKTENGLIKMTTEVTLKGTAVMDVATGQIVALDLKGDQSTKGTLSMTDDSGRSVPAGNISGKGPVTIVSTLKLRGAGGDATGGDDADHPKPPHGDATGGGNDHPKPPRTDGDTPKPPHGDATDGGGHEGGGNAEAGDSRAFVGKFVGEALTLELKLEGGKLTGTITKGEKTYPATAHVADGKLVGSFKAGDTEFEFTATLKDGVLTLKTGSKTYELKAPRHAADNPLGDDSGGGHGGGENPLGN